MVMVVILLPYGVVFSDPSKQLFSLLEQHGVDYVRTVESGDGKYEWQLVVHHHQGELRLSVFDQVTRALIYQYAELDQSDRFIQEELVALPYYSSPLIVTIWKRGVHGEQLILLDPLKKDVLYHVTSAWPLTTSVCDDRILITVSTHTDDAGEPVEETHHWYGSERVTTHKDGITGC